MWALVDALGLRKDLDRVRSVFLGTEEADRLRREGVLTDEAKEDVREMFERNVGHELRVVEVGRDEPPGLKVLAEECLARNKSYLERLKEMDKNKDE